GELAQCLVEPRTSDTSSVWMPFKDRTRRIWASTLQGEIFTLDEAGLVLKRANPWTAYRAAVKPGIINCAAFDDLGRLWLGTDKDGLIVTNRNFDLTRRLRHDPVIPSSLSSDIVKCIYADRSGILWIGTDLGGVERVDPHPAKFTVYRSSSDD